MPNWCNNSVQISGPDQEIQNLWSQMTCGEKPQPMNCLPRPEDIGDEWLAAWSRENWGTKWEMHVTDAYTGGGYIDRGYIALTGMTAWSPCLPLWEHISRLYPGLTITTSFHEEGMDFVGASRHRAGQSVVEEGSLHDGFVYNGEHNWDNDDYVEAWYDHVAAREEHYSNLVSNK